MYNHMLYFITQCNARIALPAKAANGANAPYISGKTPAPKPRHKPRKASPASPVYTAVGDDFVAYDPAMLDPAAYVPFAERVQAVSLMPCNGEILLAVGVAIAHSVLKKVLDPQAKAGSGAPSNSGGDPRIQAAKYGLYRDSKVKDCNDNLSYVLSEGMDLAQTAACKLFEYISECAANGVEFNAEMPITVHELERQTVKVTAAAPAVRERITSPIREAFRAVRRVIGTQRAIVADQSGYTYFKSYDPSEGKDFYRRMPKYYDFGNFPTSSGAGECYTIAEEDAIAAMDWIGAYSVNLSKLQAGVLHGILQGLGVDTIAARMGVSRNSVISARRVLREKCAAAGLNAPTPRRKPVPECDIIAPPQARPICLPPSLLPLYGIKAD